MAQAKVFISQPKTIAFAHQKTWPLVHRTVSQIHGGAVRLAPRGTHRSGSGAIKKGLPLARSVFTRMEDGFESITGFVGSRENHAATVHQGSKPHPIPLGRGKMLKFAWPRGEFLIARRGRRGRGRRGTRFFFFDRVTHPGNKRPVRYLTTPMHMFGRANGFRTSSIPVNRYRLP